MAAHPIEIRSPLPPREALSRIKALSPGGIAGHALVSAYVLGDSVHLFTGRRSGFPVWVRGRVVAAAGGSRFRGTARSAIAPMGLVVAVSTAGAYATTGAPPSVLLAGAAMLIVAAALAALLLRLRADDRASTVAAVEGWLDIILGDDGDEEHELG